MLKFVTFLLLVVFASRGHAQSTLETVQLKTLRGTIIPFSSAVQKDSMILVCFWSTDSEVSINELNAINANYEKWKKAVPFRFLAVSVDEGKAVTKLKAMVNMNEWKFDVYSDIEGDLRRVLHSNNLPQSMIIKKDKVIYQQSGYETGSEIYLLQKMQAIAAGKS